MKRALCACLLLAAALPAAAGGPTRPAYHGRARIDIQDFTTLVIREPRDLFLFSGRPAAPAPVAAAPGQQPAADLIDGDLPGSGGGRQELLALVAQDMQSCRACHEGSARKGGVLLFQGGQWSPNVKDGVILDAIESDSMPPDPRPKLGVEQKARFKKLAEGSK